MKKSVIVYLMLFITPLFFSCKNDGKGSSTESIDNEVQETGQSLPAEKDKIYSVADEMPRFPGCEDENAKVIEKYVCANKRLNNYIQNRLRYPKIALNNRVEGTVTAQFVVRPDGLLEDIVVFNDIGYGCGKTVLGIIESMNHMDERWIPGKIDGKGVRVRLAMPVEFRLMID